MSRMQRAKGRVWEREVARMFRAFFKRGALVKRGHQSRSGRDGADVEGTPFWIECKHQRACSPEAALRQAEEAAAGARDRRTPIAVCKTNGQPPFVALRLDRFLALVGLAFELPYDPHDVLLGLKPADLRALVADGALSATVVGTETIFESPPCAMASRGKSTLPAPAMRSRRPR